MDDRKYTIQILIIHKMDFLYFHSHAPSLHVAVSNVNVSIWIEEQRKQIKCPLLQEVERLSQQLSESQEKQGELSKEVAELKVTNTSLQGLVSTAQEALTKEQSLVKCLQEQAPSPAKVRPGVCTVGART